MTDPDRSLYLIAFIVPLLTAVSISVALHYFLLPARSRSFLVLGIVGGFFIGPMFGLGLGSLLVGDLAAVAPAWRLLLICLGQTIFCLLLVPPYRVQARVRAERSR